MGLFDTLEQAIASGVQPASGTPTPQSAIASVVQMIQAQPGGLAGVIRQFQSAGVGGVAQSWLGNGPNQSVSPSEVQKVLGPGPVAQVAEQLGATHDQAAGHIAQFLPLIFDHLSPGGQLPAAGGLGELEGLLGRV